MRIQRYYDTNTLEETRQILYDDVGNYVCEIAWQTYFDKNPSKRRAATGEEFLEELKNGLEKAKELL